MKKFYLLFCSFFFLCGSFAQTSIDPVQGGAFDIGNTFAQNGWTVVNSSANKWVVGAATFYSPLNSAYISSNGNVSNYSYDNTQAHISHFYREVTLPPEAFNISLSFFLKGIVESDADLNVIDGLNVYTDMNAPVADAMPGPTSVVRFPQFNSQPDYIQQVISLPDLAGQTFFLIFTWVNNGDGAGAGPPASVDGVSLTYCIKATDYSVTGGGAFCTGNPGVAVGLEGSTTGISYQLYNNGNPIGGPVEGTGLALDFGPQTAQGNYTVVGTSACGYDYNMTGSVNVTENPLPVATAGSNAPLCFGSTLNLTASGGTSYSWTGPNSFASLIQNPSITNVAAAAIGTYTVTVKDANGCPVQATTDVTVNTGTLAGGSITSVAICSGDGGSLSLSGNSNDPSGWEYSTDSTSASWNAISNTNNTQAFTNVTVPTFYRAVVANGCGSVYSAIATVGIHNYWTGADITNPTDWNTPGNWSDNLVPSVSCDDVYIPNTPNKPILSSGPVATIINLHILSGATLTINGAGLLQIGGMISNSGIFDVRDGTLELNGSIPKNIDGGLFKDNTIKNLIVSNTVNIANTLMDTLNISGTLSFGTSTAKLNTGNNLTLKSSVTTTANVGVLAIGNTITGNVTVERYINIGPGKHAKAWEFLATPTTGQSVHDSWMEKGLAPPGYGTQITGQGTGFDIPSPSPSMKYYDPSSSLGWTGITNTADQIFNPKGYMIFVRGDRTVNGSSVTIPNPTTLRTTGQLHVGQVTIPAGANSFASIGNPYASAIDMRKVMQDKTGNVDEFFTVWNSNLGGAFGYGAYLTYSLNPGNGNYESTPGPVINNFVQSGQAFFVQNTSGSAGSMVFNEASKANVNTGFIPFFRPAGVSGRTSQIRTNLYAVNTDGPNTVADGTLQQFSDDYSNSLDGLDARKIFNSSENLSIKSGGKNLIVERRHPLNEADTVFYNLASLKAKNYHFEFLVSNLSANGLQGFIEDIYLGTRTPLNPEGKTAIDFEVTNVAGSYAVNRFRIVFKTAVVLPVKIVSLKAYEKHAGIEVEWKVENESNVDHYEVQRSADGINFTAIAVKAPTANNGAPSTYVITDADAVDGYNYYRIKSIDINRAVAYTYVVKVQISYLKQDIAIYPNPITDGIIHLQLVNQPKGKYGIRLLNKLGQIIVQKQISRTGGSSTELIKWDYNLPHAMYQLEITRPDGSVKELNVMY